MAVPATGHPQSPAARGRISAAVTARWQREREALAEQLRGLTHLSVAEAARSVLRACELPVTPAVRRWPSGWSSWAI